MPSQDYPPKGQHGVCFSCGQRVRVGERHTCSDGTSKLKGIPGQVIGDSREKLPNSYHTQALPAGDYLITTPGGLTILVERKSWSDLAGSFESKRLHRQLWRMAEPHLADRIVLVVEKGHIPRRVQRILKAAQLYIKHRIEPIMYVAYTEGYDQTLKLLEHWADKGDEIFYAHRPLLKASGGADLPLALPGIGEGYRVKLVRSKKFKSYLDFVNNIDKAASILPTKTYQRVKAILKESWN